MNVVKISELGRNFRCQLYREGVRYLLNHVGGAGDGCEGFASERLSRAGPLPGKSFLLTSNDDSGYNELPKIPIAKYPSRQ